MKISPARAAAFDALLRVERDRAFATDALDALLERFGAKRADAALATELVLGVLRWRRLLDFLIQRFTSKRTASLDLEVVLALRLGLYQLRYLSRVPASAAVNESVELVKRARKSSAGSLVNAALRRAARDEMLRGSAGELIPAGSSLAERLGLVWSHPTWLVERWLEQFGESGTRALLEANNRAPRLTAAVVQPSQADAAAALLAEQAFKPKSGLWLASAVEIQAVAAGGTRRQARAGHTPAGAPWFMQDEASQMIPFLLHVRPGQRVLDVCAAPGGKTARLIQHSGAAPGAVTSCDVHLHRLRQMGAFLKGLGVPVPSLVALDGTRPLPFGAKFDRILVDAPCSGTGTLGRNPEIRWRLRQEDIVELGEKQKAMVRSALELLAPGGRLVYSTCSLEREENEQVIAAALEASPHVKLADGMPALTPHLQPDADARTLFDSRGYFQTLPWVHGTDGFFAAVLEAGR